jgi:alpha-galactosidase
LGFLVGGVVINFKPQAEPDRQFSLAHLSRDAQAPVSLVSLGSWCFGNDAVPLVEVFTAAEQRARTSQAYYRSAVGGRLRYVDHRWTSEPAADRLVVTQRDGGLVVRTELVRPHAADALRITHEVANESDETIVLTAVTGATIGFGSSEEDLDHWVLGTAASEWLAENRWSERPVRSLLPSVDLAFHRQDGRGHFGLTSHGAWSAGEHLPVGYLSRSSGETIAWQIETSGAWHCDLAQAMDAGVLSLLGPTDLEHQFAHALAPGGRFATVPVAISVSDSGYAGAFGELTRYRRGLVDRPSAEAALPVVYNDFMNTLMANPSTEALEPLIDAAAAAGAEYFCIDAGWFADPEVADSWPAVGEWREGSGRFSGGLGALFDRIRKRGMQGGIWLEPEVVGVESKVADLLPEDAFFQRFGQRVQEDRRYHLDFRHPAARAHLDDTVDHLVADYGVAYLKLDYNINPGAGTEWRATTAGDGLLAHARAFRQWLVDLRARHPQLLIENCASGAMRADYSLLAVTDLQSTSDQQDFRRYPPIAAAAPASILPEQCGNWAYPSAEMTDEETAFTLVTGLAGRLYLSGFLDRLRPEQRSLVAEAVDVHKRLRHLLPSAVPFWPLGLPEWDAPLVCLGLRAGDGGLLAVWDRREESGYIDIPGITRAAEVFPKTLRPWAVEVNDGVLRLHSTEGASARLFTIR